MPKEINTDWLNSNVGVLNAIRKEASLDYTRRIPEATQANLQDTLKQLLNYRPAWNEFHDALINRIGAVWVRKQSWNNPLSIFKRGLLEYGDTIEEIQVGLVTSRVYDPDGDYLEKDIFGKYDIDTQANFHKVNRQEFYPITVNEDLLKRAFLQEQGGLQSYIAGILGAPSTSDQWDEFLLMTSLFREYDANGGFFKMKIDPVSVLTSGEAEARFALRRIRAAASTLSFLSTHYNAAGMPVSAQPSELVLFCTPEFKAAIDVEGLAPIFHLDKAETISRIIEVPAEHFGIADCEAVLTTEDFFVVADQVFDTTSQFNPVSRSTNYFLHRWEVISASRFAPAIMFSTTTETVIEQAATPVSSVSDITIQDAAGTTVTGALERGERYSVFANAVTTPAGGENDAVVFAVDGNLSNRTYMTPTGVLYVGADEAATTVNVSATATWLDPEDTRAERKTKSVSRALTGDVIEVWPVPVPVEPDPEPAP